MERVYFGVSAATQLPLVMEEFGYERAFVYSSRTLNRTTTELEKLAASLGGKLVGLSDEVGEHAPISNVLKAIDRVQEAQADVIVCIGGGSVTDFGKFVQLGIATGVKNRDDLLQWRLDRWDGSTRGMQPPEGFGPTKVRQIAIPTTFSTAEITPAGTPIDDVTGAKVLFYIREGSPRAVIYDPDLLRHTPSALLAATGIRGFDHSINNVLAAQPNPIGASLSSQAIELYKQYLPRAARDGTDRYAMAQCQLATCLSALGSLGAVHGFSHYAVHVLAPWANASHGNAACVMLLAQARWFCREPDAGLVQLSAALGRPDDPFDVVVLDLLRSLNLPTSLAALGVQRAQIPELAELMLQHPSVTRNNRRPIKTMDDIVAVLESVAV